METKKIIRTAEFNPSIKNYHLLWVAFIITLTIFGIPLLLIWFLGFGQYVSKRYYENLYCVLTQRHLHFKKGVLFKVEKTIPLENIQDLTFLENPLLQYLDLRILKVETAGNSNAKGSDMTLIGIRNASEFRDAVLSQRDVLTEKADQRQTTDLADTGAISLLTEIRDLLKEMKDRSTPE